MLDVHDFTRNPKALEFGRYGVCNVRWGKASRGSQPRRRAVLTVFEWTRPVLEEYVTDVLPRFDLADSAVLWPTERQGRIRLAHIDDRFAARRYAQLGRAYCRGRVGQYRSISVIDGAF